MMCKTKIKIKFTEIRGSNAHKKKQNQHSYFEILMTAPHVAFELVPLLPKLPYKLTAAAASGDRLFLAAAETLLVYRTTNSTTGAGNNLFFLLFFSAFFLIPHSLQNRCLLLSICVYSVRLS